MSNYRWFVCGMLFLATTINYMDRQVLSLTWKDFIAPEFAWGDKEYGEITALFSIIYAIAMLVAGRLVDIIGARRGYIWAMCIWSFGAILHGFCGIITSGLLTGEWFINYYDAKEALHDHGIVGLAITSTSVWLFMACRVILSIGQSANFPAAISVTTAFFPKKDRAFAISLFNTGASVGALFAPITIPTLAKFFGWEMAFIVVGTVGYAWVLAWMLSYYKPSNNHYVNVAELNYIQQDEDSLEGTEGTTKSKRIGLLNCWRYRQTWALCFGKFLTDGAWWFFLFWTPVYISEFYAYTSDSAMGMAMIFVIYLISMLSILGGYMPTLFVNKLGLDPYAGRMRTMLIFASVQLVGIFTIPLSNISPWMLVLVIGLQAASHQSWSANLFAMVGDFFPKNSVATITGVSGFAGGLSSFLVMKQTSSLLNYAEKAGNAFSVMGHSGKQGAYMLVFCCFAFAYLIGWAIMKSLVPDGKPIEN